MHFVPQVHTGSWLAHQSISTFPPSRNFLEKELILNQRYLPHPDSDSPDLFFEIRCFVTRIPDLQLDLTDLAPGRPDLRRKFAGPKNSLQPH